MIRVEGLRKTFQSKNETVHAIRHDDIDQQNIEVILALQRREGQAIIRKGHDVISGCFQGSRRGIAKLLIVIHE